MTVFAWFYECYWRVLCSWSSDLLENWCLLSFLLWKCVIRQKYPMYADSSIPGHLLFQCNTFAILNPPLMDLVYCNFAFVEIHVECSIRKKERPLAEMDRSMRSYGSCGAKEGSIQATIISKWFTWCSSGEFKVDPPPSLLISCSVLGGNISSRICNLPFSLPLLFNLRATMVPRVNTQMSPFFVEWEKVPSAELLDHPHPWS
jgi:hypothetical protein